MGQAGGLNCLSLLLIGLGIVLVVDLQGLLLYNIEYRGIVPRVSAKSLSSSRICFVSELRG